MNTLLNTLVANYNQNDAQWASNSTARIEAAYAALPPSDSKIDPLRLGSKAVLYSKLKKGILAKQPSIVIAGQPTFNALPLTGQIRFQAQSIDKNENLWVHQLVIVPANLENFKMPAVLAVAQRKIRRLVDVGKLRVESAEISGDALLAALLPKLIDAPAHKIPEVIAALLLATGRRTVEIMQTATFYLTRDMTSTGYFAMFHGQAKHGLHETEDYMIPLLAPFHLVRQAMKHIREACPTIGLTSVQVNAKYAKTLANYTNKVVMMTPHALRGAYVAICYKLSKSKMPILGYVSSVLGHINIENATYYTRNVVKDITGPYVGVVAQQDADWVFTGVAERKRLPTLIDLMDKRQIITASSLRTAGGGSMAVAHRVIAGNKDKIDAYNLLL